MSVRIRRPIHVLLLSGGRSSERDVSLRSGDLVESELKRSGYKVTRLDPAKDIQSIARRAKSFDIAFLALHGAQGEDGTIQGFLESIGLSYTGSGVLASALAMDKTRAKAVYVSRDIPCPQGIEISADQWKKETRIAIERIVKALGKNLVVKPVSAGSSIGVALVDQIEKLQKAISKAIQADPAKRCIIEQYIKGRELTVGVIGNNLVHALPVVEICPKTDFFDLKAKYNAQFCDEICPAQIPTNIALQAQDLGIRAHQALGCRGYSRTDMIWDDVRKKIYVLETNTLPGMTQQSLLPKAAAAAGYTFASLLDEMIRLGLSHV